MLSPDGPFYNAISELPEIVVQIEAKTFEKGQHRDLFDLNNTFGSAEVPYLFEPRRTLILGFQTPFFSNNNGFSYP